MIKLVFLLMAIVGGLGTGAQAAVNGGLGKKIGSIEAAFVSFTIGTLALALFVIFMGQGNLSRVLSVPKWQLTGGLLGAFFVTVIIFGVPKLGVASTVFAVIVGQMMMSMIIDHYGFFGVTRIPFDWYRVLGILMMGIGLFFIFRSSVTT